MSRYIDADKLSERIGIVQRLNSDSVEFNRRYRATDAFINIVDMIKEEPTADVKPIVKGEWLLNDRFGFKIYDCSNCGIHMETEWNYCPHCGAKMKEVEDE